MAHLDFVVLHNKEASYQKHKVRSDRKIYGKNKNNQRINSVHRASMDMILHISHIIYLLKIIKYNKQTPHIMLRQNKPSGKKAPQYIHQFFEWNNV